ncbi:hypothetical protein ACFQZ4_53140 [Catellatospora coxensis]
MRPHPPLHAWWATWSTATPTPNDPHRLHLTDSDITALVADYAPAHAGQEH